MIGIVGGLGPWAGLDLCRKILEQTEASLDQEHLDVLMLSVPGVPDRTEFLAGRDPRNPGGPIADALVRLERAGATVAGIPCNTAFASRIYDVMTEQLTRQHAAIRVIHMVREVVNHLRREEPVRKRIGVLATNGTVASRVYEEHLVPAGFEVVYPEQAIQQERVHPAIYDRGFGIKADSAQVHPTARAYLGEALEHLSANRCEAILLACTELPLAIRDDRVGQALIVDPTRILARALIAAEAPEKLRP